MKPEIRSGETHLWLVQRGMFKDTPQDQVTGVDALLTFDYMGAAEYEFNALYYALQHFLDKYKDIVALEVDGLKDIDGNGLTMFCLNGVVKDSEATIKACAAEQYPDLKERCELWEYITGGRFNSYATRKTDFWWAFSGSYQKEYTQWMLCPTYEAQRLALALQRSYTEKFKKEVPVIAAPVAEEHRPSVRVERDYSRDRRGDIYKVTDAEGTEHRINAYAVKSVEKTPTSVTVKTANNRKCIVMCSGARQDWFVSNLEKATKGVL